LSVQLQSAGQLRRCREAVNSGNELHSAQIHARRVVPQWALAA
jgi:hypothetical protein